MENMRNAYTILVGKCECKSISGDVRVELENKKMTGRNGVVVGWIQPA
jgi:hypothetical protein